MKNRKKYLDNAGASLPLVLCVIAFLIAFSMALTYAASLLLSRTNVKTDEQRCYQLARSFAEQLDAQLTAENPSASGNKGATTDFVEFVNQFLNSSAYSNYSAASEDSTVYRYVAETTADDTENYGLIEVRLYKNTTEIGTDEKTKTLTVDNTASSKDYTEDVANIQKQTFKRYTVTVEVIASYGDLTYSYETEYDRADTYRVVFSIPSGTDSKTIVWASGAWHDGNESGAVTDLTGITEITCTYQIDTENPTAVQYSQTYPEYTAAP